MTEEKDIANFILNTMPDDIPKTIVDVGANATALFSYFFISRKWEAILIEPQPDCVECLKHMYPNTTIVQCACDTTPSTKKLYLSKSNDSQLATFNTSNDPWFSQVRSDNYVDVKCDTLTNILDENDFPKNIGVLKVDCESWDPHVLASLDFSKYNPMFVVTEEYLWEPENVMKKYTLLEDNDYVLLGYIGYNSIWRKKDKNIRYTTMILRDFYKIHDIYPTEGGNLPLKGHW